MKKYILYIVAIMASMSACNNIDNYSAPSSKLTGNIYNKNTLELIPAKAPNGAVIQLFENNSIQPTNFTCKVDGSFTNSRIFKGNYRVIPRGPFITIPEDTINTILPLKEPLDFYVDPYLTIDIVNTTKNSNNNTNGIEVTFVVSRSEQTNNKVNVCSVIYSNTQTIDENNNVSKVDISLTDEMLDQNNVVVVNNIDTTKPIFIRVAARITGTNYFNYSKVLRVE